MEKIALLLESLANKQPTEDEKLTADEGDPKTGHLPNPKDYPSSQLWELLDVGDLLAHLKEKAWSMLSKHIQAFGFDRRLGNYPAKARIRIIEGASPISLPMYTSSPAKRQFIDQQIDTWFAKGIIEPSKSLWGTPVVIAYWNDKLRF
ncbi:hypothetical protein ARMGADRAFT_943292, partial [Armillaria gallica]